MKTTYPADTVDSNNKAFPTVGENIRNGTKNLNIDSLLNLYSSIYGAKCIYDVITFTGDSSNKITTDKPIYGSTNVAIYLPVDSILITYYLVEYNTLNFTNFKSIYNNNVYGVQVKDKATDSVTGKICIIRTEV